MSHTTLELHRLLCPMPVIRVQDQVEKMQAGDTLTAICTDSGVKQDIPAWCRINGHQVLTIEESAEETYIITLQVGES